VRPYLEKPFTKIGLVEWLKMKALSSSPSTEKKKRHRGCFNPHKLEGIKDSILFLWEALWFELKVSCFLDRCFYCLSHSTS
jgi:hypothetical protein